MIGFRHLSVAAACLAIALAAAAGCGKQSVPEIVQNVELPKIPLLTRDDPPTLRSPREVNLMPGEQTTMLVVLDRHGNTGPIKAEVKNLPQGITATVDPAVDVDDIVKITLNVAADAALGDTPVDGRGSVEVTVNERFVKRDFTVLVPQVTRVAIPPQPALVIQPGTTTIWHVPVERHGFEREIEIEATPSSAAIEAYASAVPAGEAALKLRVAIAPDAVDGEAACVLKWMSYGRSMDATLPVAIVRRPFSLPAVVPVTLQRGNTCETSLRISRAGYEGPISLAIDRLPEGTQASPPGVTLEAEPAAVAFRADDSAREGVAIVPLRATAGHLMAKGLLTVRVVAETDRKSLPSAVVAALPGRFRPGGVDARRSLEARRALADFYGTTDECGKSARAALGWLASMQKENGAWPPKAAEGSSGEATDTIALSAIAVLPFLAEGIVPEKPTASTPATEPYAEVVAKALGFLDAHQPEKGGKLGSIGDSVDAHLLGLVVFSEAFALSADEKLKDECKRNAKLAVEWLMRLRGSGNGGEVPQETLARDTARAIAALQAAKVCGVGVPSDALRKAAKFLETLHTADLPLGSRFATAPGLPADADFTAACLLALACVAREVDSPTLAAGCDYLAGKAPAVGADRTECSPRFLLLAGEALRSIEGEAYDAWNAAVRSFLTSTQVKEGPLAGSWDPAIFAGETDRVWATACATLCLQSHFRYLPLSRK